MAVASLSAAAMVRRLTAVTMVRRSMVVFLAHSVLFVAVVFASDGVPPFGVFLLLIVVAVANLVAVNPSLISLAMERMGHIAGTASAVIGTLSYTGGALLAGIVDGAMTDSIGPLAIGFLVYGAAMLACMVWADGGFAPTAEPAWVRAVSRSGQVVGRDRVQQVHARWFAEQRLRGLGHLDHVGRIEMVLLRLERLPLLDQGQPARCGGGRAEIDVAAAVVASTHDDVLRPGSEPTPRGRRWRTPW